MEFPTLYSYKKSDQPNGVLWEYICANKKWYPKGIKTRMLFMVPQMCAAGAGVAVAFPPGYNQTIATYEEQYMRASYDPRDFQKISEKMKTLTFSHPDWILEFEKTFRDSTKKFRIHANNIYHNLSVSDPQELAEILTSLIDTAVIPQSYGYLTETFTIISDSYWVVDTIRELYPKITHEEVDILFQSVESSFIKKYQQFLREAKSDEELKMLSRSYYFVKGSYFEVLQLTLSDFKKERDMFVSEAQSEKSDISDKETIIRNSEDPQGLRMFVRMIERCIAIQDERKENVLRLNYALYVIAKRAQRWIQEFTLDELLSLTPHELIALLRGELNIVTKQDVVRRNRRSVWIFDNDSYTITTKTCYTDTLFELFNENLSEVKGFVASRGKAQGRVKIVLSESDFHKIKRGDILVTSMTRPEFMPVIKESVAIITDEGGITSHAAIISRELKKPCVIGTKIATKVLKDGDFVEVNANKGVVKILSKK